MDDIVRLQPASSYATLSAAVALARGRRVALVFPVGEPTCLNSMALLDALYNRCQLLSKEAVIIGGDALLRARAVAAGFEAATTLDDWGETAPEMVSIRLRHLARATPQLRLVSPETFTSYVSDEQDTWVSEPPDYVVELRQSFAGSSSAIRKPALSYPVADTVPAAIPDDHGDDAIAASERFEEMITGRILETSGLHHLAIPGTL